VRSIAVRAIRAAGAWYRHWRLVSLESSPPDVADEQANATAFGRPSPAAVRSPIRLCLSADRKIHTFILFHVGGALPAGLREIGLCQEIVNSRHVAGVSVKVR
jgi:hypothetical protein